MRESTAQCVCVDETRTLHRHIDAARQRNRWWRHGAYCRWRTVLVSDLVLRPKRFAAGGVQLSKGPAGPVVGDSHGPDPRGLRGCVADDLAWRQQRCWHNLPAKGTREPTAGDKVSTSHLA
eukprot:scaffold1484_cov241-Pinguiococcus_pyrenoidosus.AAC.7